MNKNTLVPISVAVFVIACALFLLCRFWGFYLT